jgi:hypothetical protein
LTAKIQNFSEIKALLADFQFKVDKTSCFSVPLHSNILVKPRKNERKMKKVGVSVKKRWG